MSAISKVGATAWILNKVNQLMDAVDVYQATQSNDAAVAVATELSELVGIGIPLWFLDKVLTKTGLDRVFDSLKRNQSFQDYLAQQQLNSAARDFFLGNIAEWGLHEFRNWIIENGYLDPIFEGVDSFFSSAFNFIQRRDPLILDLDGDGIETVGASSTDPILFDHDNDGLRTGTGWVSSDDGLLVLDRNSNGTIDNGGELFGDSTTLSGGGLASDGFAALADMDSNADGVVNASDTQFSNLRVWRDLNQDGISQSGELFTLADLNIASINVAHTDVTQNLSNGNTITQVGSYTHTDGTTAVVGGTNLADANLVEDTFHREFTDTIPLASGVSELPNMQGSGKVRDLWEVANDTWRMVA